jgi:autotransporter translocation and assembly factor TamB
MSLLLDVSPRPLVGGLIVFVIAILTVVVFLILAFVFLLKWLRQRKYGAGVEVRSVTQPNSPNQ